jgi:hypothetical protein
MGDGDFDTTPPEPPAPNINNNNDASPSSLTKALAQQKTTINAAQQQLTKWFKHAGTKSMINKEKENTTSIISNTSNTTTTINMNNNNIDKQNNTQQGSKDTQQESNNNTNNKISITQTETNTNMDICINSTENISVTNNLIGIQSPLEEDTIINKYVNQIDTITPEFIKTLPTTEQLVLNKLIDQQKQILPIEIPFTLVQSKNKSKTPNTSNTFNQQETTAVFEFGVNKHGSRSSTPIKANTTQTHQTKVTYGQGTGRGIGGRGRGGGQTQKANIAKPNISLETQPFKPPNLTSSNEHPYSINTTNSAFVTINNKPYNNTNDKITNNNTNTTNTDNNDNNRHINNNIISNNNKHNINTTQTTGHNNTNSLESNENQNNMKTNVESRYTFCIHISVKLSKESDIMTRDAAVEHILQLFIKAEAYTTLASTHGYRFLISNKFKRTYTK